MTLWGIYIISCTVIHKKRLYLYYYYYIKRNNWNYTSNNRVARPWSWTARDVWILSVSVQNWHRWPLYCCYTARVDLYFKLFFTLCLHSALLFSFSFFFLCPHTRIQQHEFGYRRSRSIKTNYVTYILLCYTFMNIII